MQRAVEPSHSGGHSGALVLVLCIFFCGCPASRPFLSLELSHSPSVAQQDLLELSFRHDGVYSNPFRDVSLDAVFHGPDGTAYRMEGFYWGKQIWRIRFRPAVAGVWRYRYSFRGGSGFHQDGDGVVMVTASTGKRRRNGFPLRRDPGNPFRWLEPDNRLYFPVGLQDCVYVPSQGDEPSFQIDGGDRHKPSHREVSAKEYFRIYGEAGFNLFRFSQKNCSYLLQDSLERYREREGRITDRLLADAREHGFRVMFGIFGYHGGFYGDSYPRKLFGYFKARIWGHEEAIERPGDMATVALERQFVRYAIARWGAFTDFWELLNERHADDRWTGPMAEYVRSADPFHRPVGTSWERPHLREIDLHTPHWYESEHEHESDAVIRKMAARWKSHGKPVIAGEQGNTGMNWDARSATRMRIRLWASLFEEIGTIFWNVAWAKNGMFQGVYSPGQVAGIFLGPEERGYVRVLRDVAETLDGDWRRLPVTTTEPAKVRGFGLSSKSAAVVYLHHFADHSTAAQGVRVKLGEAVQVSRGRVAHWISPSTGQRLEDGKQDADGWFPAPPFPVDIALWIR